MASFGIVSFFFVLLIASCVSNSEARECFRDVDCAFRCKHGGFCDMNTGKCSCLPVPEGLASNFVSVLDSNCQIDNDCVSQCQPECQNLKCVDGNCFCECASNSAAQERECSHVRDCALQCDGRSNCDLKTGKCVCLPAPEKLDSNIAVPVADATCVSDDQCAKACPPESVHGYHDKAESNKPKLNAIGSILVASIIGVCSPLASRLVLALSPDGDLFMVVKAFASGVILATGYMRVLPDSFNDLMSDCLPEYQWKKFSFTTSVAMQSDLETLKVDSLSMLIYKKSSAKALEAGDSG